MDLTLPYPADSSDEIARFHRLAKRLIRDAHQWAETLVRHVAPGGGGAVEGVFRETLAFAAFLVTHQSSDLPLAMSTAARERLTAALRREFEDALATIDARLAGDPPSHGKDGSRRQLERRVAFYANGNSVGLEITEEMFARFCEITGLHSTALVGSGSNLAQMLFYVRIFALVGADERVTLEQRKHLIHAAQQYRAHFAALAEETCDPARGTPAIGSAARRALRQMGVQLRAALAPPPRGTD